MRTGSSGGRLRQSAANGVAWGEGLKSHTGLRGGAGRAGTQFDAVSRRTCGGSCTVNGQPGLVAQLGGVTVTVYAFDVAGDRIKQHLGSTQPREASDLDDGLTPVSVPSGPPRPENDVSRRTN